MISPNGQKILGEGQLPPPDHDATNFGTVSSYWSVIWNVSKKICTTGLPVISSNVSTPLLLPLQQKLHRWWKLGQS